LHFDYIHSSFSSVRIYKTMRPGESVQRFQIIDEIGNEKIYESVSLNHLKQQIATEWNTTSPCIFLFTVSGHLIIHEDWNVFQYSNTMISLRAIYNKELQDAMQYEWTELHWERCLKYYCRIQDIGYFHSLNQYASRALRVHIKDCALLHICKEGYTTMLDEVLQESQLSKYILQKALEIASYVNHKDIVITLLKQNIDKKGVVIERSLYNASKNGHKEIVSLLLGCKFNPYDKNANDALTIASNLHYKDIVNTLLSHNIDYNNALNNALWKDDIEMKTLLLEHHKLYKNDKQDYDIEDNINSRIDTEMHSLLLRHSFQKNTEESSDNTRSSLFFIILHFIWLLWGYIKNKKLSIFFIHRYNKIFFIPLISFLSLFFIYKSKKIIRYDHFNEVDVMVEF